MGGVQVLFLILAGIAAAGYAWYVSLITRRNRVREAMGGIDVQLRMRFDLLPNVLELAQKFMTHEKALLTSLTSLRSMVNAPYDKDDPAAARIWRRRARLMPVSVGCLRLLRITLNCARRRRSRGRRRLTKKWRATSRQRGGFIMPPSRRSIMRSRSFPALLSRNGPMCRPFRFTKSRTRSLASLCASPTI